MLGERAGVAAPDVAIVAAPTAAIDKVACYCPILTLLHFVQEQEDLLGVSNGVAAPAVAAVVAPAAAVDDGSSLLTQYEQKHHFVAPLLLSDNIVASPTGA